MYCPICGSETSDNQKFCRSCGMDVQIIQTAVAEHLSQRGADESLTAKMIENRRKELERRGTLIMLSGSSLMVLLVVAFLIAVGFGRVFGFDLHPLGLIAPWIIALGLILMVTGIAIGIYPRLAKPSMLYSPDRVIPSVPDPASKMIVESVVEPIPSVTEHTTRKLEPVPRNEKRITAEIGS